MEEKTKKSRQLLNSPEREYKLTTNYMKSLLKVVKNKNYKIFYTHYLKEIEYFYKNSKIDEFRDGEYSYTDEFVAFCCEAQRYRVKFNINQSEDKAVKRLRALSTLSQFYIYDSFLISNRGKNSLEKIKRDYTFKTMNFTNRNLYFLTHKFSKNLLETENGNLCGTFIHYLTSQVDEFDEWLSTGKLSIFTANILHFLNSKLSHQNPNKRLYRIRRNKLFFKDKKSVESWLNLKVSNLGIPDEAKKQNDNSPVLKK